MNIKPRATSHERRATKEAQNQSQSDDYAERGPIQFGPWTSASFRSDPKRFVFQMSRYKFCAKMLVGKSQVLEVGCGDAPGVTIVLQTVGSVHGIDVEPIVIEDNLKRFACSRHCEPDTDSKSGRSNPIPSEIASASKSKTPRNDKNSNSIRISRVTFALHDLIKKPLTKKFDAVYSLDVIEHIPPTQEQKFMRHLCASLDPQAVCLMGTPNQTAQEHASIYSRQGHVNLKTAETLRALLEQYFYNVFIFSMNDEVIHTGFSPMAHYLFGMGVGVKKS